MNTHSIRSKPVEQLLYQKPCWFVRYGITFLFFLFLASFVWSATVEVEDKMVWKVDVVQQKSYSEWIVRVSSEYAQYHKLKKGLSVKLIARGNTGLIISGSIVDVKPLVSKEGGFVNLVLDEATKEVLPVACPSQFRMYATVGKISLLGRLLHQVMAQNSSMNLEARNSQQ